MFVTSDGSFIVMQLEIGFLLCYNFHKQTVTNLRSCLQFFINDPFIKNRGLLCTVNYTPT